MSAHLCPWFRALVVFVAAAAAPVAPAQPGRADGGQRTREAPMMTGAARTGMRTTPVWTVGEEHRGRDVNLRRYGHRYVGKPDGIGAFAVDARTVRVLSTHELLDGTGYPYTLANGVQLRGARISFTDVHRRTRKARAGGMAYHTIYDRAGAPVTDPAQLHEGWSAFVDGGLDRLCSAVWRAAGVHGLRDDVFFAGEEAAEFGLTPAQGHGGQLFALDPRAGVLYAAPMLGRAAFENVALLANHGTDKVVVAIADDRAAAPLYLYVGERDAAPAGSYSPPSFLRRNGLGMGRLFVWVADNGAVTPEMFNGTGAAVNGRFVPVRGFDPVFAGAPGYDGLGFASMAALDAQATAAGAFRFSRPEDIATDPADGTRAVFASTGNGALFPADNWGTTYIVDLDDRSLRSSLRLPLAQIGALGARLSILYDGDDAGGGQFVHPDAGLRSPDNLDWAADGAVYVQEDRATAPRTLFGSVSGVEASLWRLDPITGAAVRVAVVDRAAVPTGQTDQFAGVLGTWESTGVVDVGHLFTTAPGERLLLLHVQAHGLTSPAGVGLARGGVQATDLFGGGQLLFASSSRGAGRR